MNDTGKKHAVHSGIDIGQWPGPLSFKTYSGKSVYFLGARALTLLALCIYSAGHADTTVFVLAAAAFVIDIGHTALQTYIQVRGLRLQTWIKKLIAGDLDFRVEAKGDDEIAMYARVLEALRSSMEHARALDIEQKKLSKELGEALEELKATQDRIVSQQKLAELGELSAGVAHEIRNPLQFIKNFAESSSNLTEELSEQLGEPDSEASRAEIRQVMNDLSENMGRIGKHSERANRIVSDMLSMRQTTEREMRPVELNTLVVEQAKLAFQAAKAENPQTTISVEHDLDERAGEVNALPNDLGRVVINIVSNACQAMTEKAQARSDDYAAKLHIATQRENDEVRVEIRDNGIGMDDEVMERMFTPFFTTKAGRQGTGLGMSLSHDIVRAHGGRIEVDSRKGEYTTMTVTLPAPPRSRAKWSTSMTAATGG